MSLLIFWRQFTHKQSKLVFAKNCCVDTDNTIVLHWQFAILPTLQTKSSWHFGQYFSSCLGICCA